MSFSTETKFEQCPKCHGWVPFRKDEEDGKWKQSSACRPCWKIKNLYKLLGAGTKISQGESADTLRDKLQRAEAALAVLEEENTTLRWATGEGITDGIVADLEALGCRPEHASEEKGALMTQASSEIIKLRREVLVLRAADESSHKKG
jgi:hypothetical protein